MSETKEKKLKPTSRIKDDLSSILAEATVPVARRWMFAHASHAVDEAHVKRLREDAWKFTFASLGAVDLSHLAQTDKALAREIKDNLATGQRSASVPAIDTLALDHRSIPIVSGEPCLRVAADAEDPVPSVRLHVAAPNAFQFVLDLAKKALGSASGLHVTSIEDFLSNDATAPLFQRLGPKLVRCTLHCWDRFRGEDACSARKLVRTMCDHYGKSKWRALWQSILTAPKLTLLSVRPGLLAQYCANHLNNWKLLHELDLDMEDVIPGPGLLSPFPLRHWPETKAAPTSLTTLRVNGWRNVQGDYVTFWDMLSQGAPHLEQLFANLVDPQSTKASLEAFCKWCKNSSSRLRQLVLHQGGLRNVDAQDIDEFIHTLCKCTRLERLGIPLHSTYRVRLEESESSLLDPDADSISTTADDYAQKLFRALTRLRIFTTGTLDADIDLKPTSIRGSVAHELRMIGWSDRSTAFPLHGTRERFTWYPGTGLLTRLEFVDIPHPLGLRTMLEKGIAWPRLRWLHIQSEFTLETEWKQFAMWLGQCTELRGFILDEQVLGKKAGGLPKCTSDLMLQLAHCPGLRFVSLKTNGIFDAAELKRLAVLCANLEQLSIFTDPLQDLKLRIKDIKFLLDYCSGLRAFVLGDSHADVIGNHPASKCVHINLDSAYEEWGPPSFFRETLIQIGTSDAGTYTNRTDLGSFLPHRFDDIVDIIQD